MDAIKVGDMVRCGVYVLGEWNPMQSGRVVSQSSHGATSYVDIMSHHGGAPWVLPEVTAHLRKIEVTA
jgi:hypothetical protein